MTRQTQTTTGKSFLDAFRDGHAATPPIWLMRQAGRYLPEYREIRATAGGFLDLCYNPDFAIEVTLQPLRRYGFDAAILFSDILVVPHALGQDLGFVQGEGPKLSPIRSSKDLKSLGMDKFHDRLAPVYETVSGLTGKIPPTTALIGFAGAPWTVASYMVEGGASKDLGRIRHWAYSDPAGFGRLIDLLTEATGSYLIRQADHGAECLQLFESWAGALDETGFDDYVVQPSRNIVTAVKAVHPDIPIIGFPRGAGTRLEHYKRRTGVDGLGLDSGVPLEYAARVLQPLGLVQGNLDPMRLVAGGQAMFDHVDRILDMLGRGPFVFNLGHGILPETPPEHVMRLVEHIRKRG